MGDSIYGDFDGRAAYSVTRETLLRELSTLAAVPSFMRRGHEDAASSAGSVNAKVAP